MSLGSSKKHGHHQPREPAVLTSFEVRKNDFDRELSAWYRRCRRANYGEYGRGETRFAAKLLWRAGRWLPAVFPGWRWCQNIPLNLMSWMRQYDPRIVRPTTQSLAAIGFHLLGGVRLTVLSALRTVFSEAIRGSLKWRKEDELDIEVSEDVEE